ncbi:DUF4126 domain-containing protein [Edaphocola flava]|uniref:DUF4126 domain-containing protein n=1 Tax=Edaphocola flava TaxID=2499629 RepID=UPI00100C0A1F|nr:DUF4126 domain-containing protein [Edaphocola flava]
MNKEIIMAVFLGIGLSASCGFRVFVPMLVTALATHFGWFPGWVHNQFAWMGSIAAIVAFGSASVLEIAAYYIPVVDHALDTIATPLAVVAGTLLTTAVLPINDEMLRWGLGIIVGGGSAGVIQSGTVMTRLLSGKFTMTTGNGIVASGENVASIGGSLMALVLPIITGIVALIMVWVMGGWLIRRFRRSAV